MPLIQTSFRAVTAAWLARLLALLCFVIGWAFIAAEHQALWQRLPARAVDRFVADQVAQDLPAPMPGAALLALCPDDGGWLVQAWPAQRRQRIAECLSHAEAGSGAAAQRLEPAVADYRGQLQAQVDAAQAWVAAYEQQAPTVQAALVKRLSRLQTGTVASFLPREVREPVGRVNPPDGMARLLRQRIESTRALLAETQAQPHTAVQARQLGLAAAGLALAVDYGVNPPAAHLTSDKGTLADALEWQRRSRAVVARGFSLERLHGVGAMLLWSSALLVLVAAWAGGPLLPWVGATWLVGLGGLLLTDLALTGDPALRMLAERQFLWLGSGGHGVPLAWSLSVGDASVMLWWPLVLAALVLAALRLLRHGEGRFGAPLRLWAEWGASPGRGAAQALLLTLLGVLAVVALGMPAAVSEGLIGLACVAVATYVARQAALANVVPGLQWPGLVVVGGTLAAAVGLSLKRGDLGHALVALAMGGCFLWLFGGRLLRVAVTVVVLAGLGLLAVGHVQGHEHGLVALLIEALPPHAQDRMNALFDPFQANSSDLARVRWLMASAGASGWGPGYVPWQGLAAARVHEGLPLQGPSDYVTALAVAQWGQAGGLAVMAGVLLVFGGAAFVAARTTLRPGMPVAWRLLAATGMFGCVVMAGKVVLSAGGVLGVLPLTGLPVALLGYGPVSLLAGLLYLVLALGTAGGAPQKPQGVYLERAQEASGAVRQRSRTLAGLGLAGLVILMAAGAWRLHADVPRVHSSKPRLALANDVADAIKSGDAEEAPGAFDCPQVLNAVAAWNERLASLPGAPRRLQAQSLMTGRGVDSARSCRELARDLGQMLGNDWRRMVSGAAASPGKALKPNERDYFTPNAWWGVPGCLRTLAAPGAHTPCATEPGGLDDAGWTDPWLRQEMLPRLQAAVRTPQGERRVNQRVVPSGPLLLQTLDPKVQAVAQRIADCYTAHLQGAGCDGVLPADAAWRERHFGPAGLRAGALSLVLSEVDSGRVVAVAGAVSDCSVQALQRQALRDAAGHMPALQGGFPCAQLPDKTSHFLLTQHPALWMVGPGSSLKTLAALAGIETGAIAPADDARWKSILAESHEQGPVQAAALAAGQHYLDMLGKAGFGTAPSELLWGTATGAEGSPLGVRWRVPAGTGQEKLRPSAMDFATMQQLRHEKEQGVNIDKRYGAAKVNDYLAARRQADSAVGGADMRINALTLAEVWRRLDLTARGLPAAPAQHLLELPGQPAVPQAVSLGDAAAARRVLAMAGGITSSAWKGTAQGSCRVVFGACPAQGLPGLVGKTGTADFLLREDSPWVKDGLQMPAKLFGGVFSAQGKRYALAVMALRTRDASGRTVDLQSSAAAEAALTLVRELGGGTL